MTLAANQLQIPETSNMKNPVYKLIELTGTSTTSIEDAVNNAVKRAHKTIKNLRWFQVIETRGNIEKGKVHHWQVTIKVGFTVNG
jgi:flavin-binding protein dodecin